MLRIHFYLLLTSNPREMGKWGKKKTNYVKVFSECAKSRDCPPLSCMPTLKVRLKFGDQWN